MSDTPGEDAARKTAEKIRNESAQKQEEKQQAMTKALSGLANVTSNSELFKMFQENAEVGSEELSGELPILKIYSAGKSKTLLADGTKPTDGFFYYRPTQSQYADVMCHILKVSRGFYAEGIEDPKTHVKPVKWNQIVAGIMINDGDMKPFYMYFTGVKVDRLWEFGKTARKYTKAKPCPIPMFALTIHMTPAVVPSDVYSDNWAADFEVMTEEGSPLVITDPKVFMWLRKKVDEMTDVIENIISMKQVERPATARKIPAETPVEPEEEPVQQEVKDPNEEMPF